MRDCVFYTYCMFFLNTRWFKSKLMRMKIHFHTHKTEISRKGNIF